MEDRKITENASFPSLNEMNLIMQTKNIKVYKKDVAGEYEVCVNGHKQIIDDHFLLLSQMDAFDLELVQLMFVPFQGGIKREIKDENGTHSDLGGHSITIIEYHPEAVVTSFMIFSPRDDNDALYSNKGEYDARRYMYLREFYR